MTSTIKDTQGLSQQTYQIILEIFTSHIGTIKQVKNKNKKTRIISEANMNKFKVCLNDINFEQIMCPNEAYNVFMALYKSACEDSFPLRNRLIDIFKEKAKTLFMRIMKITYIKAAIEENKLNIKKAWIILRQAIGKLNDKSNYTNSFTINNTQITDKLQIAESFNIKVFR